MFDFFKKKDEKIYAPVTGKCVDIIEVKDKTFADKLIGDGVAILPENNIVAAPCDGTITSIFPTKHAFSLERKDGLGILVHIGIDTVSLNGKGFQNLVNSNAPVRTGQPVIEFDPGYLSDDGLDMTIMIVIVDYDGNISKTALNENIISKDVVMECKME